MILSILAPIFVFAVIVLIHEGGHFLTAKLTGMKVEEFSVGFGPKLGSVRKGETEYSLRAIPLGGFNRILGMDASESDDPRAFSHRPVWARLLVISAGSIFNVLLAIVIFWGAFMISGYQTFPDEPVVGAVLKGTSADKEGISPGDRILSVDGKAVGTWTDIGKTTSSLDKRIIPVTIEHNGEEKTLTILLQNNEEGRPIIGISPKLETHKAGFFKALSMSLDRCGYLLKMMVVGLYQMISGHEADVAGPIGVARMSAQVADTGILPLFLFIALLSLNLGFLNLLPIPLLDGGVLVMTIIEGIRGKELPEKALYYIQAVGISILLGLFIFAMCNDISGLMK
ncbi:RIP metalloprotease RseP [uncultured Dialister sp.]|jgi:regulator of sigma E protease|uniref:RIP metalloprotease RseP n=1 Tax=uncultured Dialister sp. TaxID=278064 RepID=UPI0025EB2582|nr:RIP metalloprotease RseP [uncultured Dialister sp.]